MYFMVDFICMDLTQALKNASENYKMISSCSQWDSNQQHSAYEATAITIALRDLSASIS